MIFESYDPLKGEMYQVIDKDGNLVGPDPDLDDGLLRQMYRWMLLTRIADEKAVNLQRQGRLGTYAPNRGQEASQVGSALATMPQDWIIPAFRELGAYMIKGMPLSKVLEYFMGDPRGNVFEEGVKSLPIFVPVGTQIPIAAGFAHAIKVKGGKEAVVCYLGDGSTSEGDFHEGLNLAGVFKSPVLYLCQNNQWAISVPRSRQTASRTLAQKSLSYGIPGVLVDGNDVVAMYLATKEALDGVRAEKGPFFIEAYTYRMWMHTTADDPSKYRTAEEEKEWEEKDPIKRFRIYLERKGIWTKHWEEEITAEAQKLIKKEVEIAESIPQPQIEDLFRYMFAEMTEEHWEQMAYLKRSLEAKEIEEEAEEIRGGFP